MRRATFETGLSQREIGPTLETLDFTIRIGSTPTFSYFDLYLYSTYALHYVNLVNMFVEFYIGYHVAILRTCVN